MRVEKMVMVLVFLLCVGFLSDNVLADPPKPSKLPIPTGGAFNCAHVAGCGAVSSLKRRVDSMESNRVYVLKVTENYLCSPDIATNPSASAICYGGEDVLAPYGTLDSASSRPLVTPAPSCPSDAVSVLSTSPNYVALSGGGYRTVTLRNIDYSLYPFERERVATTYVDTSVMRVTVCGQL